MNRLHKITGVRRLTWLAILLVIAILASAAFALAQAEGTSPSPTPSSGKVVLRVGWGDTVNSTNPLQGYLIAEYEVNHLNYDLLVGYNPSDLSPRPEIATSWTSSNGDKTWIFKIRQGVLWSDGQPLTAKDVAFTFNYIVKNQISGYTMFTAGIIDAVALDDYTVQINCTYPKADILRMWVPILPEHIWSKIPPKKAVSDFLNKPPVVGSGPFQTVELVRGQYIRLVANKSYWRGAPKVDEIIFNSYENSNTMVDELKSGALDVIMGIPSAQFVPLQNTKGITVVSGIAKGFYELGFNCYPGATSKGNPVLKDPKFRQALNYAVDKQKILDVAFLGHGTVATSVIQPGYFPPSSDFHWTPPAELAYSFDLTKAGDMLTAAGYPLQNGVRVDKQGKPIKLRLEALSNMKENQTAGKLIASWFEQLGLKIDYSVVDDGTLIGQQYNYVGDKFEPDYDMFLWNWTGLGIDPNFILSVFLTSQIGNWSDCAFSNAEYDKLYTQQSQTVDQQQRKAIIYQMEQLLWEQTPYVTTVYGTDTAAYSDNWTGWVRSPAQGGIVYSADNIDSWLTVHPKSAEVGTTSKGSGTLVVIVIVCAVIVVIGLGIYFVARSRRRVEI
jgi:peptide/nickel transport system substrate-binding protein